MSYYTTWIERSENNSNEQEYIEYVNRYYVLEKGVYENATIVITGDHSYAHNDFQNIAEPRLTALFVKRKCVRNL